MKLSLVESYTLKLLLPAFSAIFFVLLILVSGNQLFLVFKESFTTNFFNEEIFSLLFLKTLKDFPTLISLSMILSIIIVFSNLYKNSEALIMKTAGFGNLRFFKLVSKFLLIIILLEVFFSFIGLPEIKKNIYLIKQEAQNRPNYISLSRGTFQRFNNNEITIFSEDTKFIDSNQEEQILEKVFISQNKLNKVNYIYAEEGKKTIDKNTKQVFLELKNGTIISYDDQGKIYQTTKFSSNKILIYSPTSNLNKILDKDLEYTNFIDLIMLSNFESKIELAFRISQPFIVLILAYISIALGKNSSRKSKNFSVIYGILIFATIFSLKESLHSMILANEMNFLLGVFIPFIILGLIILVINNLQKF